MAKVIHSAKADSSGYTRYYFDEAVGQTQAGAVLTGKVGDDDFEMVVHGQQTIDLPSNLKEPAIDGKSIALGSS